MRKTFALLTLAVFFFACEKEEVAPVKGEVKAEKISYINFDKIQGCYPSLIQIPAVDGCV